MNCKIICVYVVFILVLTGFSATSAMSCDKTNQRETLVGIDEAFFQDGELTFGGDQHLDKLNIEGRIEEKNLDLYQNLKEKTISFHFDHSKCKSYKMDKGHVYVGIGDLEPFGLPGNPMLPMETYVLELPKNAKIIEIGVVGGVYSEIKNKLHITPNPQPVFWSNFETEGENIVNRLIPNMDIYGSDRLFPGTALSYNVGEDSKLTKVFVKIYPIQYMPKSGKPFLLADGLIKLYYTIEEESPNLSISGCSDNINIIITPPSLYDPASQLKELHDGEGTLTGIVNTTWIYDNYEEADDPPCPGYGNSTYHAGDEICNYNYSLAKRILAYLNDTANHPNLQYVTLLGNARLVPPSYYYEYYSTWVPTDFFYSSPDYDLVPNYKVGRLPVNNSEEASHVVNKIMDWDASSDLFGNITVAGGKPFSTSYDIGEMIVIDSINQGLFRGITPRKCFRTELSFDRLNLTKSLMGETGILYHIGHGSGYAWSLEGDPLGVEDLMDLSQSNTSPIVVSISCVNGAFDTNLVDMGFNVSFGESLLLSDAGGIAYIGGSRGNAGLPIFALDEGYLNIFKETYMAAMLTYLFEPFYNGTSTLGDLTFHAVARYVESHDFTDPVDSYTFFAFILLGDPALKLPVRPTGDEYQLPMSHVEDPLTFIDILDLEQSFFSPGVADSGEVSLNPMGENITYISSTNSPNVDIKIVDGLLFEDVVVERATIPTLDGGVSLDFTPNRSSLYSIRTITGDGREGWLFAASARIVDDDYDETTPGIGVTKWAKIQDAIDSSTNSEIIYVFNGTYYENACLDSSVRVIGENNGATVIDGGGKGTVVSIIGELCSISGFSIINSGSQDGDSGLSIEADMSFVANNIIKNNGGRGVAINRDVYYSILLYNKISNNSYGVYLEPDCLLAAVFSNIIRNNDCGILLSNSGSSMLAGNEIIFNDVGVHLKDCNVCMIYLNNITNSKLGIYLENSENNPIGLNNFIDNERHAKFYKCRRNMWVQNFWDKSRILPKFIFGRAGYLGLIPWINIDIMPAKTPNDIIIPLWSRIM